MELKHDINIHIDNDEAFKLACKYENKNIIKYLCEICPDYYYNINNLTKIVKYGCKKCGFEICEEIWNLWRNMKFVKKYEICEEIWNFCNILKKYL